MAEPLALRYGLSIAKRAGCNRLVINSDNLEVIETMNNGGRTEGRQVQRWQCLTIAIFWLVVFPLLGSNIVIGKQMRLLMNLPR